MFATVLAISSVSLLVGCEQNVTVDPDADANQKQEATIEDENLTAEGNDSRGKEEIGC